MSLQRQLLNASITDINRRARRHTEAADAIDKLEVIEFGITKGGGNPHREAAERFSVAARSISDGLIIEAAHGIYNTGDGE